MKLLLSFNHCYNSFRNSLIKINKLIYELQNAKYLSWYCCWKKNIFRYNLFWINRSVIFKRYIQYQRTIQSFQVFSSLIQISFVSFLLSTEDMLSAVVFLLIFSLETTPFLSCKTSSFFLSLVWPLIARKIFLSWISYMHHIWNLKEGNLILV